jgi:hypothetical protein
LKGYITSDKIPIMSISIVDKAYSSTEDDLIRYLENTLSPDQYELIPYLIGKKPVPQHAQQAINTLRQMLTIPLPENTLPRSSETISDPSIES